MKIYYHHHQKSPWNQAFDQLLKNPAGLRNFVDVTHPDDLPSDLSAHCQTSINRDQVIEVLREREGGAPNVLSQLSQRDCLVVTTGQQPGLMGGPLFTIYKIQTAIKQAEALAEALGVPVVPVFCNASDDHDWGEAKRFSIWQEGQWRGHPMVQEPAGAHLYEKKYPTAWSEVNETLQQLSADSWPTSISSGMNFASFQTKMIQKIFATSPLVVMEPRWFRHLAVDFNQKIVAHNDVIDQSLLMAGSALKLARFPQTLEHKQGFQLCFSYEGRRERLKELEPNSLGGRHATLGSLDQVMNQISQDPQMWSQNVLSRPLWMRSLLPVVADVVGPGETAYQLQIQNIYKIFQMTAPVLIPRLSATILRSRESRKLKSLQKNSWELSERPEVLLDPQLKEALLDRVSGIKNLSTSLIGQLNKAYPEIDSKLNKIDHQINKAVEKYLPMVQRAQEIREGDLSSQWESLRAWCFPQNQSQERIASWVSMNLVFGEGWWDELSKKIDPLKRSPAWVEWEGDH